MFILVLLFLILTGFFAAFRFPNLTSRLTSRLPRFNFSRAFRNPKIKALLNDRYFFNQNVSKIGEGALFVVLGKDAAKLYDTIVKNTADTESSQGNTESWTPWAERGLTEAFALLTISHVNYIFIHPSLFEKNFEENFNSRIRFFIKRVCKARQQKFLDGVVLVTSPVSSPIIPQQMKKSKISPEILDEISYTSLVFQKFSEFFKIRLPLFLIEHDFQAPHDTIAGRDLNHAHDEETHSFFGFSCDLSQKPDDQKYDEFFNASFMDFIENFHVNFQKVMGRAENLQRGIESIHIMHYVESTNRTLLQSPIRFFFNRFVQLQSYAPVSLTILNSVLFSGEDNAQSFKNIFAYISMHGMHRIEISSDLLNRRTKINRFALTATIGFFMLFSLSIWKSRQFLNLQRKEFNARVADFKMLVDSIHSSLDKVESTPASLAALQETSCRIIKSYSDVKHISFRTAFLFPSWKSNMSVELQKKYKDKFSLLFSNFLLQKYTMLLNDRMELKSLPEKASLNEAFSFFKDYVLFLSSYQTIYSQLTSNKSDQINKALTSISNIVYENKCVENEEAYDFLTTMDSQKLAEFVKLNARVKKQSSLLLEDRANKYFAAILNRNLLMSAFLNLNNDIMDFGNLVETFEKKSSYDDDDLAGVRAAFEKSVNDYQLLAREFPADHTKILSSAQDFFGPEFLELMDTVKKTPLFESQAVTALNASAQAAFESFKKQIDISATEQTKNHLPILVVDAKSELSINPKVVNLFTALNKFNEMLPSARSSELNAAKTEQILPEDLHKMASSFILNMSWVDRKLQTAVQKYANLQTQYNALDFDLYPETFSDYLQDYIFNSLEKYWSSSLASALVMVENSGADDAQDGNPDPHGLISSAVVLKQVVDFLVAERFDNVLSDFNDIYLRQIDDVLKRKTVFFERKELFGGENADFKLWDGTTSPAYDLFHAGSEETLAATLEKQKQVLSDFYSQYIEKNLKAFMPIMQAQPALRSFYYNRWYSISLALEDKTKSYQNFSNFVLGDLKKFRTDDCPNILENSRDPAFVPDYFDSRIEYLYRKLNARCRVIYMQIAIDNYEELAKSFNGLLAGKYPFVRSQANSNSSASSADIQDLEKVLEQFQNFQKGKMSFLLKYNSQFEGRADITNFISQMAKVNAFFALAPAVKPRDDTIKPRDETIKPREPRDSLARQGNLEPLDDKLHIDALFNFRSRKNEEILANRIVDWELKTGEQTYGSLFGNLQNVQFKSKYGEPFSFTLSLSKDIKPKQLSTLKKNSLQIVRNNLVSYTLKDNWSLFRFIDEHKTCSDSNALCSKEKLKFEIPLENGETVILFCDLNLLNTEGKKVFLPSFPTFAPYLTSDT